MKREEQPIKEIEVKDLLKEVEKFHKEGYRLVQACGTKMGEDSFEVMYSFDKDYRFRNIRITVPQEVEIPSITSIYGGAFLYENEIHELFGLSFKGISIDFKGHLYKKKIKYPFAQDIKKVDESCQKR